MVFEGKCPAHILQQIPYSTAYRWKYQTDFSSYHDFGIDGVEKLNLVFSQLQHSPSFYFTIARLHASFSKLFAHSSLFFEVLRNNKQTVVDTIYRAANYIPLTSVCNWLRISVHTYRSWKTEVTLPCLASSIKKCLTNKPNQLASNEVSQLAKLLSSPSLAHWSIKSICHWARRKNLVFASLSTWYKYNKLLGIRSAAFRIRKPKYESLRASQINEFWHADVSLFRTSDGAVAYIYTVVDNFSRKVLAWNVNEKLSAQIRVESLKQAYQLALKNNVTSTIKLVVDGGSENNNHIVDLFVKKNNLQKLIALKDILFSNSMVEAVNKQIKYNWLFRKHIPSIVELQKELTLFFEEHNTIKPLDALKGYTPDEVYFEEVSLTDPPFALEMTQAREQRVIFNKHNACKLCLT